MIDWIDYCLVIFHELPLLYQNQYFLTDYGILVLVVLYLREWRKRTTALHLSFLFPIFNCWVLCVCWVMAQSQEATPNLILKVCFRKFVLSWLLPNCTRDRVARLNMQSSNSRFRPGCNSCRKICVVAISQFCAARISKFCKILSKFSWFWRIFHKILKILKFCKMLNLWKF